MKFLRHIGKIGDKKVAVVFREIPGENHMCLVTYTELLNAHIHDAMMQCIESDIGQTSENLGDALNRTYTKDGKIILQVLHKEGLLKKMQTSQVLMTPNVSTSIRLDELNNILNEMKQGEEAIKKLAELDRAAGMGQPPSTYAKQIYESGARKVTERTTPAIQASPNGALDDTAIANNLRMQAEKMSREAKGLLAEAERLMNEAASLTGTQVSAPAQQVPSVTAPLQKKRGRPAKAKVAV